MAKPRDSEFLTFTNFAPGLKGAPGFQVNTRNTAASHIQNFEVDEHGRLVRRGGSIQKGSTFSDTVLKVMNVYYAPGGGGSDIDNPTTPQTHLFVQTQSSNANGLWYWNGSAFANVTTSVSPDGADDPTGNWYNKEFEWTVAGQRLFLANGFVQLWVDISKNPTTNTPVLHWWGITPNDRSGYTIKEMPQLAVEKAADGSLADGWYGYAYTYYNDTYAIESMPGYTQSVSGTPNTRVAAESETTNNTIDLSGMTDNDDAQVTHKRVYRTEAQPTEADALVADLFHLIDVVDTSTTHSDDGTTVLSTNLLQSDDHDNPPKNLHYIKHYAGRIWGADYRSSTVRFTKIDENGAPVWDTFPDESAAIPHEFYANRDDGDEIMGLEPTPNGKALQIFKENRVVLAQGSGLIGGLYQPNTDVDLDVSHINEAMGTPAPKSIATVGGKTTMFLGQDKKIWATAGGDMEAVSLPVEITPVLNAIPDSVIYKRQVSAVAYNNKYALSFPVGESDNNRVLVFDFSRKYWTMHTGIAFDDAVWATGGSHSGELYGVLSDGQSDDKALIEVFDEAAQDRGSDFNALWRTNWLQLPAESVVSGVYVYPLPSVEVSVRLDVDGDQGPTVSYTPSEANRYRLGVWGRGRTVRVVISGTTADNIERIQIEYTPRRP